MPRTPRYRFAHTVVGLSCVVAMAAPAAFAGPLDPPPGPISPSFKTIAELEPRTPISLVTTPGDRNCSYRITQAGSYYFPGKLSGEAGKHGIIISASNVTIDLSGFTFEGGSGSFTGILVEGARSNLAVLNGVITAWGSDGMNLFAGGAALNSRIENITTSLNGGAGMRVAGNSVVSFCIAEQNAGSGFISNSAVNVSNVVARANGGDGLMAGGGSTVSHSSFRGNGARGVGASSGSAVTACSAFGNEGSGVTLFDACTITGCTVSNNVGDGVTVSSNCIVIGNTFSNNGFGADGNGAGIHAFGSGNRIEANNCSGNDRGVDVDTFGNCIFRNTCRANGLNWDIADGNACFVVTAVSGGPIIGNSGGAAMPLSDPNTNITY